MENSMQIIVNFDEALFIKSAIISTLNTMDKEALKIFWPKADISNVLSQLSIILDVLFLDGE